MIALGGYIFPGAVNAFKTEPRVIERRGEIAEREKHEWHF